MDEHEPAVKQHMDTSKNKIWSLSRRYGLQPLHRVLLGHDGSMTALLELIACSEVALRTIKQSIVPCPQEAADLLAVAAGEPTNERDILIVRLSDGCLLYTSPSPRDVEESRMPSSA